MTIQEAIKRGKIFRRKGWDVGYSYDGYSYDDLHTAHLYLSIEDILADDWEIEEEKLGVKE